MKILGIDPGVSGAIAMIANGAFVGRRFMPTMKLGKSSRINCAALAQSIAEIKPDIAVVERVASMPRQGVSSTFSFGHAAGALEGILGALGIPYELVTPQTWKRHFGLIGSDKDASRAKAIQLFPTAPLERKKDIAVADALLIARWRYDQGGGQA